MKRFTIITFLLLSLILIPLTCYANDVCKPYISADGKTEGMACQSEDGTWRIKTVNVVTSEIESQPSQSWKNPIQNQNLGSEEAKSSLKNIQAALKILGFYSGSIDGIAGPSTKNAIESWQKQAGNEANGILSDDEEETILQESATKQNEIKSQSSENGTSYLSKIHGAYGTQLNKLFFALVIPLILLVHISYVVFAEKDAYQLKIVSSKEFLILCLSGLVGLMAYFMLDPSYSLIASILIFSAGFIYSLNQNIKASTVRFGIYITLFQTLSMALMFLIVLIIINHFSKPKHHRRQFS